MRLSLIIPCYNEAKSLPALVERCEAVLAAAPGSEVVLVDNGSTDDSPAVLESLLGRTEGLRSVRVPVNQGYGYGVLAGLAAATGDVIGWTHADLQADPMDAIRGFDFFKQASDPSKLYVKGNRYGRPMSDRVFTLGMSIFETILMGRVLYDINAQPNMFHRSFYEGWVDPPHDFSLDLFAYYSAKRAQLTVKRFPVKFGEREFGVSHWNVDWKSKVKFIRRTMDFSFKLKARETAKAKA